MHLSVKTTKLTEYNTEVTGTCVIIRFMLWLVCLKGVCGCGYWGCVGVYVCDGWGVGVSLWRRVLVQYRLFYMYKVLKLTIEYEE